MNKDSDDETNYKEKSSEYYDDIYDEANPNNPTNKFIIIVYDNLDEDNAPGEFLKNRLYKAVEFWRKNRDYLLVVTGGNRGTKGYTESEISKLYLTSVDVPSNAILLETDSRNIVEAASFSKKELKSFGFNINAPIVNVITSDFAANTARLVFQYNFPSSKIEIHETTSFVCDEIMNQLKKKEYENEMRIRKFYSIPKIETKEEHISLDINESLSHEEKIKRIKEYANKVKAEHFKHYFHTNHFELGDAEVEKKQKPAETNDEEYGEDDLDTIAETWKQFSELTKKKKEEINSASVVSDSKNIIKKTKTKKK
jgi:hypothetical protein